MWKDTCEDKRRLFCKLFIFRGENSREFCSVLLSSRITSRVRIGRRTMACVSVASMNAVARMPLRTARSRRPFQTTRVSLDNARREPAALAGFVSRRVKPHALRHTEQSIWIDQTRRHGRALGDTRTPRRWAMAPSNESIYTRGRRSFSQSICSPQVRASLVLACLRFLLPKRRVLTKFCSLFDANLKHTVSLRMSIKPNDG